ncbi:MAG: TetR family transcriptional regulator [Gemmatimonadetes bacterium]|nr:TetR family transcriptional regulator [Gemmatimonadota bacterium]
MGRSRAIDTQALVAAAAKVFERRGYADATLDDIAAEAGVSKPTVYQYVPSKQRLLEIIVEQAIYPLRDGIEQILESDKTAGEKLTAYVHLHVNAAIRYQPYYVVLMADQHQLSPQGLRSYQSWARQVNHATEQLLQQGINEGLVRTDIDVPVITNLLNSALISIARWYRPADRLKPTQVADQVMTLLHGLLI